MSEDSTNYDVGLLPSRFPIKEHNAQFEKRRPAVDKHPFEAVIRNLNEVLNGHRNYGWAEFELEPVKQAIAVLREWPRWNPLIEAAGRIPRGPGIPPMLDAFTNIIGDAYGTAGVELFNALRELYDLSLIAAMLDERPMKESLPAQGKEEPK